MQTIGAQIPPAILDLADESVPSSPIPAVASPDLDLSASPSSVLTSLSASSSSEVLPAPEIEETLISRALLRMNQQRRGIHAMNLKARVAVMLCMTATVVAVINMLLASAAVLGVSGGGGSSQEYPGLPPT